MWSFQHPAAAIVAGPSGAGKSQFIIRVLKNRDVMFDVKFVDIVWCYGEEKAIPEYVKNNHSIRTFQGVPSTCDIITDGDVTKPRLLILDDLQSESKSKVDDLYSRGSHHLNVSVFLILQNIFHKGKRDISLNSSYIVFFKSPRDQSQINYLARQINSKNPRVVTDAYRDSTLKSHGYLLIDLKQRTPENQRLCTNIFPDDVNTYCYVEKS